jgi:hypothetical protein
LNLSLQRLLDDLPLFIDKTLHVGTLLEMALRSDARPRLALVGRVPVKASAAEDEPISPGDLLAASTTKPGYAIKCKDAKTCEGRVIGKALEALRTGEGYVLILITNH